MSLASSRLLIGHSVIRATRSSDFRPLLFFFSRHRRRHSPIHKNMGIVCSVDGASGGGGGWM